MVGSANILGFPCPTNEVIVQSDYTNYFVPPISNWLASNPTKRPQYVILLQDLPSRYYFASGQETSVQLDLRYNGLTNYPLRWNPFVTSINMNGTDGAADCLAYIDKLAYFGSNYSPGKVIITPRAGGYGNTNWYFDDDLITNVFQYDLGAAAGVTNLVSSSNIFVAPNLQINSRATNVAGYFSPGWDGGTGDTNFFRDGTVHFYGQSGWYIMGTVDSFSGQRDEYPEFPQADFLTWFASNSLGGTNYSNTPVGAVGYVDEPHGGQWGKPLYYGDWASGMTFAICAWQAQYFGWSGQAVFFQAVGDPFVRR
jgi:hypothetical protein